MRIYFAPLEGITGYRFRQLYEKHFGGIDRYYSPFMTTRDGGIMKKKEKRDVLPENNQAYHLVPQVMTNHAKDFCQTARHMEEMGYEEINLNLGCPSGTVVAKNRGAGFLRVPDELDRFFAEIFDHCPIGISVKTRIGFYEAEEFYRLLEIYNQYPIKELIIHLRTRVEMYKGEVHREMFDYAVRHSRNPLCYNGDVCTPEDIRELARQYPDLASCMIGRGFLMHPGFVKGWSDECQEPPVVTREPMGEPIGEPIEKYIDFMNELEQSYLSYMSGEMPVLFKMKEIWVYLQESLPEKERWFKKIKKAKKLTEYDGIIREMQSEFG